MERDPTFDPAEAQRQIQTLRARVDELERRANLTELPHTMLLDPSFLKRAFAVLGHYLVASLLIALPIYLLIFLIMLLFGLSEGLGG
jgi:membrane-bound ClpP family serine protease